MARFSNPEDDCWDKIRRLMVAKRLKIVKIGDH
jgi:hypothetical protein